MSEQLKDLKRDRRRVSNDQNQIQKETISQAPTKSTMVSNQ